MGGGTLQLVAYGGQDIHIIGNPELSFFKSVYRRHTNFAMECIKQTMLGSTSAEAFKASFKLGREGDLINKMHLEIKLPEQKDLLLIRSPMELNFDDIGISITTGGIQTDVKNNILSHIEIINPGNNYIYGATIRVGPSYNIAEASIDSNNRIKDIRVYNRETIYEIGEEPLIIIDGLFIRDAKIKECLLFVI